MNKLLLRKIGFLKTGVCLLCAWMVVPNSQAGELPLWERGISFHPTSGYGPENKFSLRSIRQEGLHLTGECFYYQLANENPAVAALQGTKTAEGEFWPDVASQVRNEQNGKWDTISEPFNHGHRATVMVKPGESKQDLMVSLDVFLPFVGKCKLGRVVLRSGEVATFELKYLLEDVSETEKR